MLVRYLGLWWRVYRCAPIACSSFFANPEPGLFYNPFDKIPNCALATQFVFIPVMVFGIVEKAMRFDYEKSRVNWTL